MPRQTSNINIEHSYELPLVGLNQITKVQQILQTIAGLAMETAEDNVGEVISRSTVSSGNWQEVYERALGYKHYRKND